MKEYILSEEEIDEVAEFSPDWIMRHAVELIRCKECKYFVHDTDCYGDCSNEGGAKGFVYTTDYCSCAERKE